MKRKVLFAVMLALGSSGQACSERGPSGAPAPALNEEKKVMTLRVRLGEGFQNNTVSVRVDGKQVYQRSGVSTDWTISRADAVDVHTAADSVQLEVSVDGGPPVAQAIAPARTPFVEVRSVNGELQLHALEQEPPML
ncbi:hypothetical protein [Massilia timonae]|nr:hypothetical protein [Massilia timonae]OIJ42735.1 putative lipoprotein [Massilia timonae]